MRNNAGAKRGRWRATIASGGEGVGYVTLKVVDKDGNFCPTASVPVTVTVSGAGRFYAAEGLSPVTAHISCK